MLVKIKPALPFKHPAKFIGTWFGVGLSPFMPGTMGSIAALPFAYVIQKYFGNQTLMIASLVAFLVGWAVCDIYLPHTRANDPSEIVIDEVAGQWLLLSFLYPTFTSYVVGLILFRLFDILKPWPISLADQKIHSGFGVMFDDILAALYPLGMLWCIVALASYVDRDIDLSIVAHFLARHYVF